MNYDKVTKGGWFLFSQCTYVTDLGQPLMFYPARICNNSDALLIYVIYFDVAILSYSLHDFKFVLRLCHYLDAVTNI